VQLIPKPSNGNPLELREFFKNVEATYEVVEPSNHNLFLRLCVERLEERLKLSYYLERVYIHGNK